MDYVAILTIISWNKYVLSQGLARYFMTIYFFYFIAFLQSTQDT
jgi:hypothetical protein